MSSTLNHYSNDYHNDLQLCIRPVRRVTIQSRPRPRAQVEAVWISYRRTIFTILVRAVSEQTSLCESGFGLVQLSTNPTLRNSTSFPICTQHSLDQLCIESHSKTVYSLPIAHLTCIDVDLYSGPPEASINVHIPESLETDRRTRRGSMVHPIQTEVCTSTPRNPPRGDRGNANCPSGVYLGQHV
jgi:hypothetical protein